MNEKVIDIDSPKKSSFKFRMQVLKYLQIYVQIQIIQAQLNLHLLAPDPHTHFKKENNMKKWGIPKYYETKQFCFLIIIADLSFYLLPT